MNFMSVSNLSKCNAVFFLAFVHIFNILGKNVFMIDMTLKQVKLQLVPFTNHSN